MRRSIERSVKLLTISIAFALFLTGAFDCISVVIRHTLVQTLTPDRMRGRVSAISGMFISASNELGGFESGTLAKFTSPVFAVIFGGVGTLGVVAAAAAAIPQLRTFGRLDGKDLRNETVPPSSAAEASEEPTAPLAETS